MSNDKFLDNEFIDEERDMKVTLTYEENQVGKDSIYVRVYDSIEGGSWDGYRFRISDEQNHECYYVTNNHDPKPAIQAVEALSSAGWKCTNFPLNELQEEYKEEMREEFRSIFKNHLELYEGIGGAGIVPHGDLPEDANPDEFEEFAGNYAIDTDSEVVQKLSREVTARIWLLDWLVEQQIETGYTVSELLGESDAPDAPSMWDGGMSFDVENRLLAKEVVSALSDAMQELGYDYAVESNNPFFVDTDDE